MHVHFVQHPSTLASLAGLAHLPGVGWGWGGRAGGVRRRGRGVSEAAAYLELPGVSMDIDILEWWAAHEEEFVPHLSATAMQ